MRAMPKKKEKPTASIIEIIQDMVSRGEKEEKIIGTLKDLGVEPEKAKRLLLLGQADTFALLRSEIGKIVEEDVAKSKAELEAFIAKQAEKQSKGMGDAIAKQIRADLEEYEKSLTGKSEKFEKQIGDTVAKVTELSDRVRSKLNALGEQVKQVRIDLDEMRISGVGTRNKLISFTLLGLGLIFILMALYRFIVQFEAVLTIDAVVITVVYSFVGMGLLFLATQL